MTRAERNKDYRENFNSYVNALMKFPDALLEKKLDFVQQQIQLAVKNKDEEVYETLMLWERQIIEARILKSELPADEVVEYIDEIELAIAENNAEARRHAARERILESDANEPVEEKNAGLQEPRSNQFKTREEDNNQTSLF